MAVSLTSYPQLMAHARVLITLLVFAWLVPVVREGAPSIVFRAEAWDDQAVGAEHRVFGKVRVADLATLVDAGDEFGEVRCIGVGDEVHHHASAPDTMRITVR